MWSWVRTEAENKGLTFMAGRPQLAECEPVDGDALGSRGQPPRLMLWGDLNTTNNTQQHTSDNQCTAIPFMTQPKSLEALGGWV